MLLKLLMKIWPGFVPIISYILWVFIVEGIILKKLLKREKKLEEANTIDGEYKVVGEKTSKNTVNSSKISQFSLKNRQFLIVLYLSFAFAIVTLVYTAFFVSEPKKGDYIPAQYKDGKIVPAILD